MYINRSLEMVRGDTFAFNLELEGLEGLTIKDVSFCVKHNERDLDAVALVKKTLGNGVTQIGEDKYQIRVAPEDTERVQPGRYVYDLELTVANEVYTLLKGRIKIWQDVKHERSQNA